MNRSRNETFMRLATALHSHAVRAEKPARKSSTPSVIFDRFCCLLRRADCATGYTVHRRRNNFWTLEIIDPLDLDEIFDLTQLTADRIDWSIGLLNLLSDISNWLCYRYDSQAKLFLFTETSRYSCLKYRICATNRLYRIEITCACHYHYPRTILSKRCL